MGGNALTDNFYRFHLDHRHSDCLLHGWTSTEFLDSNDRRQSQCA
jgi:hypothetical protein